MKYVVADGVCFYINGIAYDEGKEVKKEFFKPESDFDKYVEAKKILAVGKEEKKAADDKADKADAPADKAGEADKADKKAGKDKK